VIALSANLGFLWTDRPLPDAIAAASAAGFDAVECHMPYAYDPAAVGRVLDETRLDMVSLNTRIGDRPDELGVAAVPGREALARQYIDEAIGYAAAIGCGKVSVVAGITGRTPEAEAIYRENLRYAADQAEPHGIQILIEPLNTGISEDYHLVSADRGVETITAVGAPNLKLMIDCFHTYKMDGGLRPVFERVLPHVGHVQFASYPDRAEPDHGEVDYSTLLPWLVDAGFDGPFGAEYTPAGTVEDGLSWMIPWRKAATDTSGDTA
jgi:hydroxypyruvate isomerase